MVRGSEQALIAGISRQDRKSAVGFFSQSADEYPRGSAVLGMRSDGVHSRMMGSYVRWGE
jgi:hypothetical protein